MPKNQPTVITSPDIPEGVVVTRNIGTIGPVDDEIEQPKPQPGAAAEAAAAEADIIDKPFELQFRDAKFEIPPKVLRGYKFTMGLQTNPARALAIVLGSQEAAARLDSLVEDDEEFYTVANEFFDALAKAVGSGNG